MLSKAKIKYIRSLQRKKMRQRYGKFIAEGDKIVSEMLAHPGVAFDCLVATSDWLAQPPSLLHNVPIIKTDARGMREISCLSTPAEVLAVADILPAPVNHTVVEQDFSLFLDGIQDPGNLGTILRIADWFGIQHVFLGHDTVDAYNPKAIQASMGAFLRVSIVPISITDLAVRFPHIRIMGADMGGHNIFGLSPNEYRGIVVIGNEGNGISSTTKPFITDWVGIPSHGAAESLNAAVATGIICAVFRHGQEK